jgi:hypothetical protein
MRLSTLYQQLSPEQREDLARKADISPGYLYQIATRWQGRKPTVPLMDKLAKADRRLTLADMVAEFSEVPEPKSAPQGS